MPGPTPTPGAITTVLDWTTLWWTTAAAALFALVAAVISLWTLHRWSIRHRAPDEDDDSIPWGDRPAA
jgi:hypothetical protein